MLLRNCYSTEDSTRTYGDAANNIYRNCYSQGESVCSEISLAYPAQWREAILALLFRRIDSKRRSEMGEMKA
jgi:hypothetical protein